MKKGFSTCNKFLIAFFAIFFAYIIRKGCPRHCNRNRNRNLPEIAISTTLQPPELRDIIDSLTNESRSGTTFTFWTKILAQPGHLAIPRNATLFVTVDGVDLLELHTTRDKIVYNNNFIDPLIFPYHIVPMRLSYLDLNQLSHGTRVPTLLPGRSLLVDHDSSGSVTINGVPITRYDIYKSYDVLVHGVGGGTHNNVMVPKYSLMVSISIYVYWFASLTASEIVLVYMKNRSPKRFGEKAVEDMLDLVYTLRINAFALVVIPPYVKYCYQGVPFKLFS